MRDSNRAAMRQATRGPITLGDIACFDEQRYTELNPDVRAAVERGAVRSALEHYARHGLWEGRAFPERPEGWRQRVARALDGIKAAGHRAEKLLARGAMPALQPRAAVQVADDVAPPSLRGSLLRALDETAELEVAARLDPGCYLLTLWICSDKKKAFASFVFEDEEEREVGGGGLLHSSRKPARRLLWIEQRRAVRIRCAPLGSAGLFIVRAFRLRRVDRRFAESRMLRRLSHHAPQYLGWSADSIRASLVRETTGNGETRADSWALMRRSYEATFTPPASQEGYAGWLRHLEAPRLALLDAERAVLLAGMKRRPLISVLVPVYDTNEADLRACLDSVMAQSYPDWELCIVDDASGEAHVRRALEEYAALDRRIKIHFRKSNGHIAVASNDALRMATGEYVALLDHDDQLARHALLEVVLALERRPGAVLVYSDEDKLGPAADRKDPHFKPDFDPDRLLAQCYLGHFVVARTARVREVGGFRQGYEGSQDHDLWLRLTDTIQAGDVVHIPWVLYHWRESGESTAARTDAKPYAAEAGLAAVRNALERRGLSAAAEPHALVRNAYRVRWLLPDPPPVSIIVPTRDAVHLLETCVLNLLKRTRYPEFELLIVDNDSKEPETRAFFERIVADEPRVRVVSYRGRFNFAAINNFAVDKAQGEVIALVNNDVEPIQREWLREMVAQACRLEIGCVGAKLLYPDGTIQHAGVILGVGGVAGHARKHLPDRGDGYFGRTHLTHSVSAVTGACLVVRKELYQAVGGMDADRLPVAFNDVDLCLKIQALGKRNLMVPDAILYHRESASRGSDQDPSKIERFRGEIETMKERWGPKLTADPYYNPQLTLVREDFGF